MGSQISITIENGFYALRSPKDQRLIDALKALIPARQRAWNEKARAWLIDPAAIDKCLLAVERAGYEKPDVPPMLTSQAVVATVQRVFTVEYVGQCKERDGGSVTALGSVKGSWSVEFPEAILQSFFEDKQQHVIRTDFQTAYQKLCVVESASDNEIKKAYWRLSRIYHPDVNHEEDTTEKFLELRNAYEILSDNQKRRRYDAGLYFEREAVKNQDTGYKSLRSHRRSRFQNSYYRTPLHCGVITAEGVQRLSRFQVSNILSWDDITDVQGRIMVTSWPKGSESFIVEWV